MSLLRFPLPPPRPPPFLSSVIRPITSSPLSHRKGGEVLDSDTSDELISEVASVLQQQRSRSRWSFLKSLLRNTNLTPSQVSQVILRLRNKPHLALNFFHWTTRHKINSNSYRHDLSAHSTLIHVLARARLRRHALSVIQSAILISDDNREDEDSVPKIFKVLVKSYRECDSAPLVFDLVIRACLTAKRIDLAIAIARVLRSRGIFLQERTVSEMILVVSKIRGCNAGFEIYREIFLESERSGGIRGFKPNLGVFNALLLSFYRNGKLGTGKASEISSEMDRFGCSPNCFSYSILMAGFCDEGKVEEAMKIWEEMRSRKINPDITAYNTIIGCLCEAADVEKAEKLFRQMLIGEEGEVGLEPMGVTYSHLIKGHCKAKDVNSAILVYNDMRRKGFEVEVKTVEKLLDGMCYRGRVDDGLRVFRNEMGREGFGFHPSRKCYMLLLKGLCSDGRMEDAVRLQAEMVGKGFDADGEVYGAFIYGYTKMGEVEKVVMVREEMLKLGISEVYVEDKKLEIDSSSYFHSSIDGIRPVICCRQFR